MRKIWPDNVKLVKLGVEELREEGVRFTDQQNITHVDTIVWATGFKKTFPFISKVLPFRFDLFFVSLSTFAIFFACHAVLAYFFLPFRFCFISVCLSVLFRISELPFCMYSISGRHSIKGIVSPDWKGLQMVSLDRFEV
jgi:hypothetical protein